MEEKTVANWKSTLLGVFSKLLAAFSLLILNTIVRKMKLHYDDVLLVRAIVQTSLGLILAKNNKEPVWIKEADVDKSIIKIRLQLISFGFAAAMFDSTDLIAIYFMPLGDCMTIIMSSFLPTMILAAMFLNERLRLYKSFLAILALTGIVLVIRPPFLFENSMEEATTQRLNETMPVVINNTFSSELDFSSRINGPRSQYYYLGAFAALIAMVSVAVKRILTKILIQNKSTNSLGILLFYNSFDNLIVTFLLPAFGGNQRILFPSNDVENYDAWQWVGISAVVVLGITQYSVGFIAVRLIGPTPVGFIGTSEIIMAYVIQITIFGGIPHATSLMGSGLVMIACIGVIVENWVIKRVNAKIQHLL